MPTFENVTVIKKANVFFDGKCVSHTVLLPDGTRKSVGVILPSTLTFDVQTREIMEVVAGHAVVRVGQGELRGYGPGESWDVPPGSSFTVTASEPLHYICHFE